MILKSELSNINRQMRLTSNKTNPHHQKSRASIELQMIEELNQNHIVSIIIRYNFTKLWAIQKKKKKKSFYKHLEKEKDGEKRPEKGSSRHYLRWKKRTKTEIKCCSEIRNRRDEKRNQE